jgi:hypothetical protein
MLAKCANPECSRVFRYFGTGKLYRVAEQKPVTNPKAAVEHFWLCEDCAPLMMLVVERGGKILVLPRRFARAYREAVGALSRVPEISYGTATAAHGGHPEN